MAEYTPMPWRIEGYKGGRLPDRVTSYVLYPSADDEEEGISADDPIGEIYGPSEHEGQMCANAAFIVKAVNCHEELVRALDGLLSALAMGPLDIAAQYGADAHPDEPVIDAAHKARAALAKAREQDND